MPTVEEFFPFATPSKRDGEPALPHNLLDKNLYRDTPKRKELVEWEQWALTQPDAQLLLIHHKMRTTIAQDILMFGRNTPVPSQDTINFYKRQFFRIAEGIRAEGNGAILDKFWLHNAELRNPLTK